MGNAVWKVLAIVSGVVGARVAKAASDGTWKAATGGKPPANPADPDVSWKEAAVFAIVSGAIMGAAQLAQLARQRPFALGPAAALAQVEPGGRGREHDEPQEGREARGVARIDVAERLHRVERQGKR